MHIVDMKYLFSLSLFLLGVSFFSFFFFVIAPPDSFPAHLVTKDVNDASNNIYLPLFTLWVKNWPVYLTCVVMGAEDQEMLLMYVRKCRCGRKTLLLLRVTFYAITNYFICKCSHNPLTGKSRDN